MHSVGFRGFVWRIILESFSAVNACELFLYFEMSTYIMHALDIIWFCVITHSRRIHVHYLLLYQSFLHFQRPLCATFIANEIAFSRQRHKTNERPLTKWIFDLIPLKTTFKTEYINFESKLTEMYATTVPTVLRKFVADINEDQFANPIVWSGNLTVWNIEMHLSLYWTLRKRC